MALKSRFGYRAPVPGISSRKGQTKQISFYDGRNTYTDNDDLKPTELLDAIDGRWIKKGRYQTRKGLDRYSTPAGESLNMQRTSVTGAGLFTINGTQALADKLTSSLTQRITRVDLNIKSTANSKGVIVVELYSDASGAPGSLIGRSSIKPADISSTLTYMPVYFWSAPLVTSGSAVWIIVRGQNTEVGDYQVSTTTQATTALQSQTAGGAWTSTTFALNWKVYSTPSTPIKGLIRSYRPNGQKITNFFYGGTMATVNDGTGAITTIKTDFNPGSTRVRTWMSQDAVYIATGVEKPWKYDFTTVTQINTYPYIPSLVMEHQGLMFFNDVDDKTRIAFSNFADFATYTSTDFIYVPTPKSYDSLTAFAKLNGSFYLFANRNKFVLLGTDNDTFSLDEAPDQRGTFSQESLVFDSNFIYHADEEGVHMFNGTDSINLAENFLEEYRAIPDKSSINLDIANNRLYIFYAPAGAAANTECFVVNLLNRKVESLDINTPVGRTYGRYTQDDLFIVGSNLVPALYYSELDTNDYHNLGDVINFEIDTSYGDMDAPGAPKRIPKWRPQFPSVIGAYAIQAGYDVDKQGTPVFQDVDISGAGIRYNTGQKYNTGARYAGQRMIEPKLHIPGTFNRVQRIYRHIAAREPVEVDSEVMTVETQRIV